MLSELEARQLQREFRPKFRDDVAFETSWNRYFDRAKGRENVADLRSWLEVDQRRDAIRAIGRARQEPVLPTPNGVERTDCWHCQGLRFVRRDVEAGHPDFGQVLDCPACGAGVRRCGCRKCQPDGLAAFDHTTCVDSTGHDFLHHDACPRCQAAAFGVEQRPIPHPSGSRLNYIRLLAEEMRKRGAFA